MLFNYRLEVWKLGPPNELVMVKERPTMDELTEELHMEDHYYDTTDYEIRALRLVKEK